MHLEDFFSCQGNTFLISRQQASDFAKNIAGDFNPIHDTEAKRFCVPGDLLFALGIYQYGLCEHMCFSFGGMVSENIPLIFPETDANEISICDDKKKEYLNISRSGKCNYDRNLTALLTKEYVNFSGQTFPHILVPLMKEQNVMINTERPLVIYERMMINIDDFDFHLPSLELRSSELDVDGKRGNVSLKFVVNENGMVVGHGEKNIVLSGLREYDQEKINILVKDYNHRKSNY